MKQGLEVRVYKTWLPFVDAYRTFLRNPGAQRKSVQLLQNAPSICARIPEKSSVSIHEGEPGFGHPNCNALFLLTASPGTFLPIPARFRRFLRLSVSLPLENRLRGGARSTFQVDAEPQAFTYEFSSFSG